jgi:hypothetical protein
VRISAYSLPTSGLIPNLATVAKKRPAAWTRQGWLGTDVVNGNDLLLESIFANGQPWFPPIRCGPITLVVANFALTKYWAFQILRVPPLPLGENESVAT